MFRRRAPAPVPSRHNACLGAGHRQEALRLGADIVDHRLVSGKRAGALPYSQFKRLEHRTSDTTGRLRPHGHHRMALCTEATISPD